ncbi:MAG TPA: VOC family protein [Rhizomicrobium sp.]|jgi:glyoxylase I family protein|nr:VOC family protein [Rhizomicrobium sp.]
MPEGLPHERVDVIGLDHIYLAVSDFAVSEKFYDTVLSLMDFRKIDREIGGDAHRHYFNKAMQISIRPSRGLAKHDPYAPGLHHLCLQVASAEELDRLARLLREAGIDVTEPTLYPEYAPDYYAIFFSDPDGMRLEVVARRIQRNRIVARWNELTTFLNPFVQLKD